MTDEKLTQEQADEKQINDAFQELLDRYLESKHRKKVEIITKAFNLPSKHIKVYDAVRANLIYCTLLR